MFHIDDDNQRYAFMEWRSRWNNDTGKVPIINQEEEAAYLTTRMGTILIDLSDTESVDAFANQMIAAVNMLLKAKKEYEDVTSQQ